MSILGRYFQRGIQMVGPYEIDNSKFPMGEGLLSIMVTQIIFNKWIREKGRRKEI